jgi:peroxiredoxin
MGPYVGWRTMQATTSLSSIEIGDRAPDARIATSDGDETALSSFWTSTPHGAVIVLMRNFGCLFCRDQARRLRDAVPQLADLGINLVAVGIGTPQDADGFASWLRLPFPVLGQPDTSVHSAWGLGRSNAGAMFDADLVKAGFRALQSGSMQGRPTGDSRQLPGTFLVDRDGIVRWARPGRHPGDHPSIEELLAAVDGVRLEGIAVST